MITNEVQCRATKAHLEQFEQASANIEARPGRRTKSNNSNWTSYAPRPTTCAMNSQNTSGCAAAPSRRSARRVWRNWRRCWSRRASPADGRNVSLPERLAWPNSRSSGMRPTSTGRPASPVRATSPTRSASRWHSRRTQSDGGMITPASAVRPSGTTTIQRSTGPVRSAAVDERARGPRRRWSARGQ